MTERRQNMSDFLASLNGAAPNPTDFDDTYLLQTTDFLNFDNDAPAFDGNNVLTGIPDGSSSNNFSSWEGLSPNNNFLGEDFINVPLAVTKPQQNNFMIPDLTISATTAASPTPSTHTARRKAASSNDQNLTLEERTRLAAEEDKRRRNTAASARFRVKKKQKEQALEKHAKEMQEKVSKLEKRVSELETENKWLKGLVTERVDGESDQLSEMLSRIKDEDLADLKAGTDSDVSI